MNFGHPLVQRDSRRGGAQILGDCGLKSGLLSSQPRSNARWHPRRWRQFLREAIEGPIAFAAEGKQYRFTDTNATGKLIAGLIGNSTASGVPKMKSPLR